jgi:hypothetical protein
MERVQRTPIDLGDLQEQHVFDTPAIACIPQNKLVRGKFCTE